MMRFDGHRYIHCRWCGGAGCLQCAVEADKAYKAAFPEGPKPIASFDLTDPEQARRAKELLSPTAMRSHFGKDGGGLDAFEASLRAEPIHRRDGDEG